MQSPKFGSVRQCKALRHCLIVERSCKHHPNLIEGHKTNNNNAIQIQSAAELYRNILITLTYLIKLLLKSQPGVY